MSVSDAVLCSLWVLVVTIPCSVGAGVGMAHAWGRDHVGVLLATWVIALVTLIDVTAMVAIWGGVS